MRAIARAAGVHRGPGTVARPFVFAPVRLREIRDRLGDTVEVRVTPRASSSRVDVERGPDGGIEIRVRVTAPPERGKANRAVVELLARELGVAPTALEIVRGARSRRKTIRIGER